MAKVIGDVIIELERCKGCELCIVACPENVLALADKINQKGYRYVEKVNQNCTGCAACAIVCPDYVFTVYRKVLKST